ncbi:L-amino acid N-acyltransferase YncA [Promicromonospora umidemergens]|uniref:GNAT family N-acetyltransferase n=1 Tax=Promicromonospora umidemergens TaxID=629679 RepID=A0ABP8WKW7_9MICO|nr:GNAT family N-acetyltransferase [Promicromonospora umidemergens]MCP2283860.1 L-amino acid N-acyltransferase YncA [Promicromonospora umidemergens]
MAADLLVRAATPDDAPALAALRWRWAVPDRTPSDDEAREFAGALRRWMEERGERSVCQIAVLDGDLVGMAWLAVFERAPNPGDLVRRSGDVQSVFVLPEHQGSGIGRRLMEAICAAADGLGVRKLTLDARDSAVPFYERLGFSARNGLMQR